MYPGFRRYVEENGPEQGRVVYDAIAPGRDSIEAFFAHGIDCDLERSGSLQLAATPAQVAELPALVAGRRALGFEARAVETDRPFRRALYVREGMFRQVPRGPRGSSKPTRPPIRDYNDVRALLQRFGYTLHIKSRGEEERERRSNPRYCARRWVVERSHSWMNCFRRLLICWEKRVANYEAMLHFACAWITLRAASVFG